MGREMSLHTLFSQEEMKDVLEAAYAKLSPQDQQALARMNARRAKQHSIDNFGMDSFLLFILVGLNHPEVCRLVEAIFEKERG